MADAVPFNYATFLATFPAFVAPQAAVTIPEQLVALYWGIAEGYWRNDGTSPCSTVTQQARLMNLITAHIAKLMAPAANGGQAGGLVGRISNASEGSVSVGTEFKADGSASMAFFTQTEYGAMAWQLMASYRMFVYRAPPVRFPNGLWPSRR
jgi:hypothetical protein